MTWNGLIDLIHNAALLMATVYLFDVVQRGRWFKRAFARDFIVGLFIGVLCVALAMTPWILTPSLSVDAVGVAFILTGLFFGFVPALTALSMVTGYHLLRGGEQVVLSVIGFLSTAGVGLIWRYFRIDSLGHLRVRELYLVAASLFCLMLVVHILLYPDIIENLPVLLLICLLLYPLTTVAVGSLYIRRYREMEDSDLLVERELLYRAQFDLGYTGLAIIYPKTKGIKTNPRFCEILGYSEEQLTTLTLQDFIHPDNFAEATELFRRIFDGGINHFERQWRYIHSSGSTIYLNIAASSGSVDGKLELIVINLHDRTTEELRAVALRGSQEQLAFVLKGSSLGFWDWDIESGRVEHNEQWAKMFDYDPGEIGGGVRQWIHILHPDDRPRVWESVNNHLAGLSPQHKLEYRIRKKNGEYKWILDTAMIVSYSENHRPLRMCGTYTDIDERKRNDISRQLASVVYDNSSEAMLVTDAQGVVISVNPAYCSMTGYAEEEVVGVKFPLFSDNFFSENELNEGRWQGEVTERRKNGEDYIAWMTVNTIFRDDESIDQHIVLFSDITQRKESEEIIWRQANFDPLTGLPNRRMLMDHLETEIRKCKRSRNSLVLLFLDLDSFKEVNDTLGHDKGDQLLEEAANRLSQCVRSSDIVARLGGDEFTVILTDIEDPSIIERIARAILKRLSEPFQLQVDTAYVSASIGITLFPQDADTADGLLKNADQAMYAAKDQGRNRFNYYTPSMQRAARLRMELANDLRTALANEKSLMVYYQPIIDLTTMQVAKAEALLRWKHPVRGFVSPAQFIPIAEDTGLINELGFWTFKQACLDAANWRDSFGVHVPISVNKSPVQFRDERNSLQRWFEFMELLGLHGEDVLIEITEGLLLDLSDVVKNKLLAFRDAKIQVAIDDFGTGYSSLAYLRKFDIDYLKIDKSFVQNITASRDDYALCEAIIVMAHKLGVKVIAEGVETQEQLDLLLAAQCDFAQGYWFAKPQAADEFAAEFLFAGPVLKD